MDVPQRGQNLADLGHIGQDDATRRVKPHLKMAFIAADHPVTGAQRRVGGEIRWSDPRELAHASEPGTDSRVRWSLIHRQFLGHERLSKVPAWLTSRTFVWIAPPKASLW